MQYLMYRKAQLSILSSLYQIVVKLDEQIHLLEQCSPMNHPTQEFLPFITWYFITIR